MTTVTERPRSQRRERRNTPKAALTLIGYRQMKGLTFPKLIDELVDDAFGHGAATQVRIIIDTRANTIWVRDNGTGFLDINAATTIGQHTEEYANDLSRYGQGGTIAAVVLGNRLRLQSTRNGRYHECTWDWEQCIRDNQWPLTYRGRGLEPPDDLPQGAVWEIQGIRIRITLQQIENLVTELGKTYWPRLEHGSQINVTYRTRTGEREWSVEAPAPPASVSLVSFRSHVTTEDGLILGFQGEGGYGTDLTSAQSFASIAVADRVIDQTRRPFDGLTKLWARIRLDPVWRNYTSTIKSDGLVEYEEELYAAIRETPEMTDAISIARQQQQNLNIQGIQNRFTTLLNNLFTEFRADPNGTQQAVVKPFPSNTEGWQDHDPPRHRNPDNDKRKPTRRGVLRPVSEFQSRTGPVNLQLSDGATWANAPGQPGPGTDIPGEASLDGGQVTIYLNKHYPLLRDLLDGRNPDPNERSILSEIVNLMADAFVASWMDKGERGTGVKHFPGVVRRLKHDVQRAEPLDATWVRNVFKAEIGSAAARLLQEPVEVEVAA
jgi:anti-sigma regulatory factor (Ser/Thr protein kinase)